MTEAYASKVASAAAEAVRRALAVRRKRRAVLRVVLPTAKMADTILDVNLVSTPSSVWFAVLAPARHSSSGSLSTGMAATGIPAVSSAVNVPVMVKVLSAIAFASISASVG